jgi:hypothetical protein
MVDSMQKSMLFAFMALAIFIPPLGSMPISPSNQPRALILSSTQNQYPMLYADRVTTELKEAGYNVTFLSSSTISLNLFTATQLDQYDIIIWRTDSYILGNTTYWYLGLQNNETYTGAIGIRSIAVANGMLAADADFFSYSFAPNSLTHVKLAILMSSMSMTIAQSLITAGVKTTIDLYQNLIAPASLLDWVTWSLIGYLTTGNDVRDSIYKTIYNYEYVSSQEDSYLPPLQFLGNGNLQIV